ncbi:MAG TPA: hypothetical protein VI172_02825 [Candidatus Dormibacteraeota bacterium]
MAKRFTIQADDEAECAEGLRELIDGLGLTLLMEPRQNIGNGWMARAVPAPRPEPVPE